MDVGRLLPEVHLPFVGERLRHDMLDGVAGRPDGFFGMEMVF